MQPQLCFFMSIAFSFIAWGIVTTLYLWPDLRVRQRADALRPLLILHSFGFVGLHFWSQALCRPICRLPLRILRPMGTSLRQHSHCLRSYSCHVGLALSSHGSSISGVQPTC
jgi:hypothetical protein